MSASKLVKPDREYKDSYLEAMREFQAENRYSHINLDELSASFDSYIDALNAGKGYIHKPFQDWMEKVPETTLWLEKDGKYIGTITVRHRLNWHLEKWGGHINFIVRPSMRDKGYGKKLLQKAIPCICYLGLEKALLTVAPDNAAALRVVEFCGGKFEDETPATEQFPAMRRYWLDCA